MNRHEQGKRSPASWTDGRGEKAEREVEREVEDRASGANRDTPAHPPELRAQCPRLDDLDGGDTGARPTRGAGSPRGEREGAGGQSGLSVHGELIPRPSASHAGLSLRGPSSTVPRRARQRAPIRSARTPLPRKSKNGTGFFNPIPFFGGKPVAAYAFS